MNTMQTNTELELAREFVEHTGVHVFLTGKAGTGKTTFLHQLRERSSKRMIVTAPTGVAALNAGGVTLHSFFQLPFGPILPDQNQQPAYRFSKDKINIIKSLDLLVIDEVSMVRADMLDGVDAVLRRFRNPKLPFGGVQCLLIGDLHQLPPVVKPNEWSLLSAHYASPYFFSSQALLQSGYTGIELKKVYRQSQTEFIELLNEVRDERWTQDVLEALNARYQTIGSLADRDRYITLTTHNHKADVINQENLQQLPSESVFYSAIIEGDFPENTFPVDVELELKVGAKVMFTRNDSSEDKQYYNGKIGLVEQLETNAVTVFCEEDQQRIRIERVLWENSQYKINAETNAIEAKVLGSFSQIPLRLAWAITIHKSQGLTFDRAIIDAEDAFTSGQTYVALSRCRSLEGLVLSSRIAMPDYAANEALHRFDTYLESNVPNQMQLDDARRLFQLQALNETFDFSRERQAMSWWLSSVKRSKGAVTNLSADMLEGLLSDVEQKLFAVGAKFLPQLSAYCQTGLPSENESLNQRLIKAGHYFDEQLAPIVSKLVDFQFDADNQADKKKVLRNHEQCRDLFVVKGALFKSLSGGFDLAALLKARAEASITAAKPSTKKTKAPLLTEADIPYPELFEKLRHWRKEKADVMRVPAYTILHQKALVQIVCHLPVSEEALLALPGIGPATVEMYGADLVEQVSDYCQEAGVDSAQHQPPTAKAQESEPIKQKVRKSETGKASFLLTLELFQAGNNIDEIVAARAMALSTIENHLAQAIEQGLLPLSEVLADLSIITDIQHAIENAEGGAMKPIKDALGENVSYGQIRWVQAHLKHIESSKFDHESV